MDWKILLIPRNLNEGVEPLDFIVRLAALAPKTLALLAGQALPKLRVNLTRFYGVFAPNRRHRAQVTPARLCIPFYLAVGVHVTMRCPLR